MAFLTQLFNICTCCLGPLVWAKLKEYIKFSTWRLNRQVLLGVSCSLCCVTLILVSVLSINMVLLFNSTREDLTKAVTDDMMDHFRKRSIDVNNQLNNLRLFSAQNVLKNKAVIEHSIDNSYFSPEYPLNHRSFTPKTFSTVTESDRQIVKGTNKQISKQFLTYSDP
jgi:hypothetical protein